MYVFKDCQICRKYILFPATATLLNYGLETGWISPMTKILQSNQSATGSPLTDSEISWIGSSLSLVAMFGVPLYAYIADTYGRKIAVICIAVPQVVCWALKLSATNTSILILARIIGGIPSGGCFNVVPMYIKEISQDNIRGAVVSLSILMQNFGLFIMYAMYNMEYYTVMWIAMMVPLIVCVGMVFAPESPGFLVKKGKIEEAKKTIALLRGLNTDDKTVTDELGLMIKEEEHFNSLPRITFTGIFKNRVWRRGFMLIMLVITGQAANGTFAMMTYAWTILTALGVTIDPDLLSLVVPGLMILGSVMSMACVEKTGRKMLLAVTFILASASMAAMGATILMPLYGVTPPLWLPITAVAVSAWAYAGGITPMTYVVMSEIFCYQVRAKLIGCIVSYAWFTSSMQVALFAPTSEFLGMYTMFFAFTGTNLFGAVVTLALLPETKGKTIEEIEDILNR